MAEKILGKIDYAEIGMIADYPFLFGLQLGFSLNGGKFGICDGAKFAVNMNVKCDWDEKEREYAIAKMMDFIYDTLKDAKVRSVSDLVGIPVEVTIVNNTFKSFRILTEVP